MNEEKSIIDEMVDAQLEATGDMGDASVAFVEEAGDFGDESSGAVAEANAIYGEGIVEFSQEMGGESPDEQ